MKHIFDYADRYNAFTRDLLIRFGQRKGNVILSPFSILLLLCMAADSTGSETKEQIINVICGDRPYENVKNAVKDLYSLLDDSAVSIANALCVKETIKDSIKEDFKKTLSSVYKAELFSSKNIVNDVNKWVSKKTKGMINEIADKSMESMLACLMNAICFEEKWDKPYEDEDIEESEFCNADGTTSDIQMMFSKEHEYISNDLYDGFVKPYRGNKFSFMALLPKKRSFLSLLHSLSSLDLTELYNSKENRAVLVDMPEFRYDFSENLTSYLAKQGMEKVFTPDADFSPMTDEWVMADSIIHKAFIEVDRKGTKAAAATAMMAFAGCAPDLDIPRIRLDRPFIYAIMNNETGLPIFAGITANI